MRMAMRVATIFVILAREQPQLSPSQLARTIDDTRVKSLRSITSSLGVRVKKLNIPLRTTPSPPTKLPLYHLLTSVTERALARKWKPRKIAEIAPS